MRKTVLVGFMLAVLIALGFAIWWLTKPSAEESVAGARGKGAVRATVPVRVEAARIQPVPIVINAIGSVEPEQSVAIRPQIGGVLQKVYFKEGQSVRAGQMLFRLDAAPLEAQAAQSRALIARDRAQLAQAKLQVQRLAPLAQKEYVSRQEFDQARTAASTAGAALAADQAQLRQVESQLAYSRIRSPIAGRTGSLSVTAGNLVAANSATPLVLINQMQPILLDFSIPEQRLAEVRRYDAQGPLSVEAIHEQTGQVLDTGQLRFIDNTVNPQNGTVLLKARMPNAGETLWPGQFVAVKLILHVQRHAVTVPESALQMGQTGPYVYLAEKQRAVMHPVKVDRQVDNLVVIAAGLRGGEPVISQVPNMLHPGSPVKIVTPAAGTGAPQDGKHRRERHP